MSGKIPVLFSAIILLNTNCNLKEDIDYDPTPKEVFIDSILIISYPETNAWDNPWDTDNTPPDIFITIQDVSNNALQTVLRTDTIFNIENNVETRIDLSDQNIKLDSSDLQRRYQYTIEDFDSGPLGGQIMIQRYQSFYDGRFLSDYILLGGSAYNIRVYLSYIL